MSSDDDSTPHEFLCPIMQTIMDDPVIACDGHSYERSAIAHWLRPGRMSSPITGLILDDSTLIANVALRKLVEDWRQSHQRRQQRKLVAADLDFAVKLREQDLLTSKDATRRLRGENLALTAKLRVVETQRDQLRHHIGQLQERLSAFRTLALAPLPAFASVVVTDEVQAQVQADDDEDEEDSTSIPSSAVKLTKGKADAYTQGVAPSSNPLSSEPMQVLLRACEAGGGGLSRARDHCKPSAETWAQLIAFAHAHTAQPRCQYALAWCYDFGEGVQKDDAQAAQWYRLAGAQDHALSQSNLGNCYLNGRGVEKDHTQAVKWYRLAVAQGYAFAQKSLGSCYLNGQGVEKDHTQAVELFRLAAAQGNAVAQIHLGHCYATGKGVEKDYTQAVQWYRLAAAQGDAFAQRQLKQLLG